MTDIETQTRTSAADTTADTAADDSTAIFDEATHALALHLYAQECNRPWGAKEYFNELRSLREGSTLSAQCLLYALEEAGFELVRTRRSTDDD